MVQPYLFDFRFSVERSVRGHTRAIHEGLSNRGLFTRFETVYAASISEAHGRSKLET